MILTRTEIQETNLMFCQLLLAVKEHFADNNNGKIQFDFEYCDGLGNVAMTKVQAEPGYAIYMHGNEDKLSKNTNTDLRWLETVEPYSTIKGNPAKQYEPYFSTNFLSEDSL